MKLVLQTLLRWTWDLPHTYQVCTPSLEVQNYILHVFYLFILSRCRSIHLYRSHQGFNNPFHNLFEIKKNNTCIVYLVNNKYTIWEN